MKFRLPASCAAIMFTLCLFTTARPAHAAPPGSTGQCNDGSYSQSAEKRGACRGHQGVKEWYPGASASQPSGKAAKSSQPVVASSSSTSTSASGGSSAGAKGVCNDGSYSQSAEKKGACRGHQGVKEWYGDATASKPAGKAANSSQPAATPSRPSPSTSASSSGIAPSGAKGQCNDDSYSFDAMKKGACRGHKGVKAWFGADAPAPAQAASSPTPTPASAPSKQSAATPAQSTSSNQTKSSAPAPTMQQRSGGGPGQVWVNTATKVYHCSGDRYYGRTKEGSYMSESDAKSKGFRADAGKPCSR